MAREKNIASPKQMWDNYFILEKYFCKGNIMNNQNRNNLGDQFRYAVQDAINKGDFKKLNYLVTDTVTDAIAEASVQLKKAGDEVQKEFQSASRTNTYKNTQQQNRVVSSKKNMPISKTKNVGQVSSILYTVFGAIGTGVNLLIVLISLLVMLFTAEASLLPGVLFFGIGLGGFGFMLHTGISQNRRLSRMKRYIALCDDNMYININELAQHTQKSIQYVLKDVKKMLQLGFFPEGHLDKKETCLMLDDGTYREYLRVEQERSALAQEEALKKATPLTEAEKQQQELVAMINEGQGYIEKLHYLNDLIEDETVSEKLYRMEDLLKEIFQRLKEAPEQMPKMRKLMNYYLPTTIKLLQAYSEFDDVNTPNTDITSAKTEIEKTIDIINEAFTELLNKLFQDSAFDATTDAQVLQTMLAKEGLTKTKVGEEI